MKIGVLIELFKDTNIDAKFAELRAMGLDGCQLVCWDRKQINSPETADEVNRTAQKHGIRITAFWCGWEGRRVWDFYISVFLSPIHYHQPMEER